MSTVNRRNLLIAAAAGLAAGPLATAAASASPGGSTEPYATDPKLASPGTSAAPKVYIDPGHGGSESGAVGNGLVEKDLTLAIALQVRDILTANYDVTIRMSRTGDETRSLDYRSSDANSWGADRFVSIHINAAGGTGFESFRYTTTSDTTVAMHTTLHANIISAMNSYTPITDRGKKTANFHVLRETVMPAVLTENLFIDRAEDAALLKDPEFLAVVAQGHANGIAEHLGLQRKA